jgi:hypothetical protein
MYLAWSYEKHTADADWLERRQTQQLRPGFWDDLLGVVDTLVSHGLLFPVRFVVGLSDGQQEVLVPPGIESVPDRIVEHLKERLDGVFFESILEVHGATSILEDGMSAPVRRNGSIQITEFDGLSRRFSFMVDPWPFVPIKSAGNFAYEQNGTAWQLNAARLHAAILDLQQLLSGWEQYPGEGEFLVDEIFVQSATHILVHPNVLDLADLVTDKQIVSMRAAATDLLSSRV